MSFGLWWGMRGMGEMMDCEVLLRRGEGGATTCNAELY